MRAHCRVWRLRERIFISEVASVGDPRVLWSSSYGEDLSENGSRVLSFVLWQLPRTFIIKCIWRRWIPIRWTTFLRCLPSSVTPYTVLRVHPRSTSRRRTFSRLLLATKKALARCIKQWQRRLAVQYTSRCRRQTRPTPLPLCCLSIPCLEQWTHFPIVTLRLRIVIVRPALLMKSRNSCSYPNIRQTMFRD